MLHLQRARATVRLRLAKVARVEDEAADDVSAVVACDVPNVNDAGGRTPLS